ncbi:NAD(P)-binding protein [Peniophora sp. CONT]|nr:NAD(P)-binding protein [Peniophora sp. CONT]
MTIKIGFVGLSKSNGWAAYALAPPLFSEPLKSKYTLTALSTSTPTSASENAKHFGEIAHNDVRAYHGPTKAIAEDDALDLVAVAVKAPLHRAALMPMLEKGRNVFVEWPAGDNIAETRELVAKAQEKGVRTIVGLQGWQAPVLKKIREIIAEGQIGTVLNVTWHAAKLPFQPYWTPFVETSAEYTTDPAHGATLLDVWVGHNLSMITRALGPLASLSATGTISIPTIKVGKSEADSKDVQAKVPDQYSIGGVFADSGALFSGSWRTLPLGATNTAPTLLWLIEGTKGQLRVQVDADVPVGGFPHVLPPKVLFVNGEKIELEEENSQFGGNTGKAWAEYARGAEGEYPTFADALVLKKHVEAVKKSMAEGVRVAVNDV